MGVEAALAVVAGAAAVIGTPLANPPTHSAQIATALTARDLCANLLARAVPITPKPRRSTATWPRYRIGRSHKTAGSPARQKPDLTRFGALWPTLAISHGFACASTAFVARPTLRREAAP